MIQNVHVQVDKEFHYDYYSIMIQLFRKYLILTLVMSPKTALRFLGTLSNASSATRLA